MFRLPALVIVAKIIVVKRRISEMAARLRASMDGEDPKDPKDADDFELFYRMLKYEGVLGDAKPLLKRCEQLGLLPQEIGAIE